MAQKTQQDAAKPDPEKVPQPPDFKPDAPQSVTGIVRFLDHHDKATQRRILCAVCALLDIGADFDELDELSDGKAG